jgi:transglutaminase-like putative cysteine protease
MNCTIRHSIACFISVICLVTLTSTVRAQWTVPTAEELKMTSQPEVPGAAAVYLFREETTDDRLHTWSKYIRLKVLTEGGKKYANVELTQYTSSDYGGYSVNDIAGRTIHPDGTIVPFTGKPMEKLVEKGQGFKMMAKVFTLPDVEVGSIIEYRYQLRYDDNYFIAPAWYIQTELYTRKAHYLWRPTGRPLITKSERGEQLTNTIAWTPILPKGFEVKQAHTPNGSTYEGEQITLELDIHDIAPLPDEEYMPPLNSLTYRVLFYYSAYRTMEEYWKNEGKGWSKLNDKFIGPGNKVKEAVKELAGPSDTADQKLRKLYASVMKLDNTMYSRGRSAAEEKSEGLNSPKSTDDILERKRGTDDQIAQLFVAMARAAGMKAYVMSVTARDRAMFVPQYLSFSQLNDLIAIVVVDGKEVFFDPGQRYCPYGHLAWKHTWASGLRQTEAGSALAETPGESYTASRTQRIAQLTMDEQGEMKGTVKMTWTGAPALSWRQSYLRGDSTSLNRDLRVAMEQLLANGMEIKVVGYQNADDYEQPFIVSYEVKGRIGSSTGKRLLVPSDIFEANSRPTFAHERREALIWFEYANTVLDGVQVTYPRNMAVESVPVSEQLQLQKFAVYALKTDSTPSRFTVHREFDLGTILYKVEEYPDLRAFYGKFETKDQEPVVLKIVAPSAAGN